MADNTFDIFYRIARGQTPVHRQIMRVELEIGGTVLTYKTGGNLAQGVFRLDLNEHPELLGTDLALNVLAWDDTCNCVPSIERFIHQG